MNNANRQRVRFLKLVAVLLSILFSTQVWANKRQSSAAAARKFRRVERFATQLPRLRVRVANHLDQPKVDKATAVAAIVRIMDKVFMRVGSERYTKPDPKHPDRKQSFGASSLRKRHVVVEGDVVKLTFRGKSGVDWKRQIRDRQLASTLRLFLAQPGERLFQVPSSGSRSKTRAVTERDVRDLLSQYGGKPKDFRTYHANRLLDKELSKKTRPTSRVEAEKQLSSAIKAVASQMGHTPGVCKSSYLDESRLRRYTVGLE